MVGMINEQCKKIKTEIFLVENLQPWVKETRYRTKHVPPPHMEHKLTSPNEKHQPSSLKHLFASYEYI